MKEITRKPWFRRVALSLALVCIAVILELLLSNYRNLFASREESQDVNLGASAVTLQELGYSSSGGYATYTVQKVPASIRSVRLSLTQGQTHITAPVKTVFWALDAKKTDAAIVLKTVYPSFGVEEPETEVYFLDLEGVEGKDFYVTFYDAPADAVVNEVVLNPSEGTFRFHGGRFLCFLLILAAVLACRFLSLHKEVFDPKNKKHLLSMGAVLLCCLIFTGVFCGVFVKGNGAVPYPLPEGVDRYNPYVQQTDAFLKGQISIDYPVSEDLLALENPYDPGQRSGIYYLWDRAMYEGKYYSYFGIAPILNVYLPYYALQGVLPCESTVSTFYCVISALFLGVLPALYVTLYRKRISVALLAGGTVALLFSSGIFLLARGYNYFYYIALSAGIAYLSAFLVFLLLGLHCRHRVGRPVLLALAGLSYGMLFLSRLNMALLAAFLVVPVLVFAIILRRPAIDRETPRQEQKSAPDAAAAEMSCGKSRPSLAPILWDLGALGFFVLLAVIFSFWFNHARFGSIFEFGTRYQLTVSDVSQNALRLSGISDMLYHYFWQPLELTGVFPFVSLKYSSLGGYGTYVYVDTGMGLFALPLTWGLFAAIPFFRNKKKTPFAKWTVGALLFGIFFVAWMNFCLGGVIFRYTFDVAPLGSLLALLLLFSFSEEKEGQRRALPQGLVGCLFGLAAFSMLFLCFSYNPNLSQYDPSIFSALASLFE